LGHWFSGLSHEARLNPTCCCINIEKRCRLGILKKLNHIFYLLFKLSLNLPSQPNYVGTTPIQFNFKPMLSKKTNQYVSKLTYSY
jgi:hypothetical protein